MRLRGTLLLTSLPILLSAQKDPGGDATLLERKDLLDRTVNVPGIGFDVPGIDLLSFGDARYTTGDDSSYKVRALPDTSWNDGIPEDRDTVPTARHHWLRMHFLLDRTLDAVPMVLNISCSADLHVYVNGNEVLHAVPAPFDTVTAGRAKQEYPPISFPVVMRADGHPHTIAIRVDNGPGSNAGIPPIMVSLHVADISAVVQTIDLHHGLYIGINLIIFILSMILWSMDRADRNWLLLASITLITAFLAFAEAADLLGMGSAGSTHRNLTIVNAALEFWPMFLLFLLLRRLLGTENRRRTRVYAVAMVLLTLGIALGSLLSGDDPDYGIEMDHVGDDLSVVWAVTIVVALVVGLLVAITLLGIVVDVVRLGIKLLRSHGYVRWIGAGALMTSLSSIFFGLVRGMSDMPETSWLATLSDYCGYVGLPTTVAIFLAVRSAHHNRAVARQRDDLDREVHERTAELRQERDRSDELLLNILPQEVAEELKRTGAAAAKHFDQASVLFTDFKGFTTMSEKVGATELLEELNTCFKAFDDIIGARGIEKIKTIGDAYMCAGGLPDPSSSSPADVVFAALEMQDFMEKRRKEREALGKFAFAMRVGIHTGAVVAGIVGVKKFQYDIWGDTVNTASRMESSSEVGRVNISESTYVLVKDASTALGKTAFSFTPRGMVQAKGKGEMAMYFVARA